MCSFTSSPLPHYQPYVHFPPSPSLTTTHTTHSRASYDRTPIVVAPNACALPARGCPGRNYTLSPPTSPTVQHTSRRPRQSAYAQDIPSASSSSLSSSSPAGCTASRVRASTNTRPRTPFAVPSLIPDEGSSEESDGVASPPEFAYPSSTHATLTHVDFAHPSAYHTAPSIPHAHRPALASQARLHKPRSEHIPPRSSFSPAAWGSDVTCLGGF